MKTDEWKKITSVQKLFTISRKLSQDFFFYANICQKKPDVPTEHLGWKVYFRKMRNGALNTLVHQSIDNHLIKKENGMTLTFLGILLSVKMLLGMNWDLLIVMVKNTSTMHKFDWSKQLLHIQTYLYDSMNEQLHSSK